MFYTVLFMDKDEIPQDFETYKEAKEYAEERDCGEYIIESMDGELV